MPTVYAGATVDILDALGLDHRISAEGGDGPLIEWQTPETSSDAPETPTLELVGLVQGENDPDVSTTVTELPLPVDTLPGDILLVAAFAGAFNDPITCLDPRIVATPFRQGSNHSFSKAALVGWGVADESTDPIEVYCHADAADISCSLYVYRTNGNPADATVSSAGFVNPGDDSGPCFPTMPIAPGDPSAGLLIVAATSHTHTLTDANGAWIQDSSGVTVNTAHTRSFYAPEGTPGAHIVESSTGTELGVWAALSLRVDPLTSDPGESTVWTGDPDLSHALINYQLRYGRTDSRSRLQTVQIVVIGAAAVATSPEVGDNFRIGLCEAAATELGLTGSESARFTGEVTDVSLDPANGRWTVTGVGTIARKARVALDLSTAPLETAHDRIVRILAAIDADRGLIDDPTPAADLSTPEQITAASNHIDQVTDSTQGSLVQQLDGSTDWQDPEHRRGLSPRIVLSDSEILNDLVWTQKVSGLVNSATVNYLGGQVIVIDHASDDARGPYPVTVSTLLTTSGDATLIGNLLVGRFSQPVWDLPNLTVDVARTIDPTHLDDLFRLRFSDRLTITDLPAGGPYVGETDMFVEGFTDTASRFSWRIAIAVSDPSRSGVSIRWLDVDPDLQWSDVDPSIRWLDVARIEHGDELGVPSFHLDGGDSTTTSGYVRSFDGGDSTNLGPYDRTITGGDSS